MAVELMIFDALALAAGELEIAGGVGVGGSWNSRLSSSQAFLNPFPSLMQVN